MIVTLRQWVRPTMRFAPNVPIRLVNQTMPVNISGREITGKIIAASLHPEAPELEISLELPDDDPTVAAFARTVGTHTLRLGTGGAPQAYEALGDLLDRVVPPPVSADQP